MGRALAQLEADEEVRSHAAADSIAAVSASSLAARRGLAAGVSDEDEYEPTEHVEEQDELPADGGSSTAASAGATASDTKGEAVVATAAAAGSSSSKRQVCQNTCSKVRANFPMLHACSHFCRMSYFARGWHGWASCNWTMSCLVLPFVGL